MAKRTLGVLIHGAGWVSARHIAAFQHNPASRVVAISTFSDLRTVATERAPFFASAGNIREAIGIAEKQASFVVDEVSPVRAAARLSVPVLLIHGAADDETPPAHSERVHAALKGPKRLLLLPKGGHAVSLDEATWKVIDEWLTPVADRQ